ncbi:predicted protein [Streptomyces viridochromogenes DSM 40736]|uniref:Predicted protein n=1 Tax=Streptomyces viridochromogenes (strain DSM 40736 / JCM 4977 / BCRC 1201 / Tue 494) TaxID=591159 RepID=D9XC85_STRVT|nr:hypothetical protein [Streptomyces viridochromogenes]EFL30316.1 predicted protein [Streptomyces viridochromogenes DSM 40736]
MKVYRTKVLGACAAAVACVALANSPAFAGADAQARSNGSHGCSFNSEGRFVADGDTLYIKDTCAEGWAAVLKVDVAPMKPNEWDYDHLITNHGGNGTTKTENGFNFPEGRKICISAGISTGGEMGDFGAWRCGKT